MKKYSVSSILILSIFTLSSYAGPTAKETSAAKKIQDAFREHRQSLRHAERDRLSASPILHALNQVEELTDTVSRVGISPVSCGSSTDPLPDFFKEGGKLYFSDDSTAGFGVTGDHELKSIFNNGNRKGLGAEMVKTAKKLGATQLWC